MCVCVCVCVCEAPLNDWGNVSSADISFDYGEYGFSAVGI